MEFLAEKTERLDKFLATHQTKFSRSQWQRFIRDGVIKVNGNLVIKPGMTVQKGDRILILEEKILSGGKEFAIEPEPEIPLNIVYEDKDVVVVNKPAGLLVHPTFTRRRHTLVNALVARYPKIIGVGDPSTGSGQGNSLRPGIVHRLDKDTSGIIVAAKNQEAFEFLKNQFLNRTIQKTYLALVEGVPKAPRPRNGEAGVPVPRPEAGMAAEGLATEGLGKKEGVISFQIRPSKRNRLKKVAITKLDTSGKRSVRTAETYYKVKKIFGDFSLLEVQPKTGRTHQIRVHLSAIGHPVVGDRLYGSKTQIYADQNADQRGKSPVKRQMLHAASIRFTAPSGKQLFLEAELPEDFKKLIKNEKLPLVRQ